MAENTNFVFWLGFILLNLLIVISCTNCWKITIFIIGGALCYRWSIAICMCNNQHTVHPTQELATITDENTNRLIVTIDNVPDFSRLYIEDTQSPLHKQFFTCCICLEDNEIDLKTLLCGHKYHRECIETWFTKEESCPLCRDEFTNT